MTLSLLETLNSISTSLAILAHQIRAEALAGLGSRNKVAEHVLLPVLRRMYNAPGLANTNALAANFPGIDLYDSSSGLGVQVTSEVTAGKITQTIETLVAGSFPLTRLVFALAANTVPRYRTETRAKWRISTKGRFTFDPKADVLAFDDLLTRIQHLPMADISAIDAELQALVRGTHQIHLVPHLQNQVKAQLAEEQRIARYIPNVFVETQDTKYQARCFAHPTLFIQRIAAWFNRQPLAGLNRLATMSGVPTVSMPSTEALVAADTLERAVAAAQAFMKDIENLDMMLTPYSEIGRSGGAAIPRDTARAHVLNETQYYIEMTAEGTKYRLRNRSTELRCVTARVFLLTGPAGQGKTNFLCDFTERFLLRHNIPCAYITARQISRFPYSDLNDVVRQLIFPSAVTTLEEGLTTLAAPCAERQQPFVLVIDGLNEHPDVRTFAGQLEHFLETLVRYPYIRVLMTCRSEFLEQRFGTLLSGPLAPILHLSKAHGQRFDQEQHRELVARYFRFFKVRPSRVARRVIDFLQRDVLLLRFFCEAYGARGRNSQYKQPVVAGIYRDEIFRRYVEDKLGRAEHSVVSDRSMPRPLVHRVELRRVLSLVAAHMLDAGQYANVSRTVVAAALDAELTALLDEELVLRHDLGPAPSLLAEPNEVLSFTFDEMRDFLLAQHLLDVHARNPGEFARLVALQQPTHTQGVEGMQRFLFYASRIPTNRSFFESYRTHSWYGAVYDTEVFAVPPMYLDAEDRQIVEAVLTSGDARAQHFAREIALRWETSVFPILNLEMLLTVARHADQSFFSDVLVPTFGHASYGQNTLGEEFCRFVETRVLPEFAPNEEHPYDPIFRLLLLLLPIGANPTLDSPAVTVFRQLIAGHPAYALGLLQEALHDGLRWHRAFVWRLLSVAVASIPDPAPFIVLAHADATSDRSDTLIRRESERFITCVSAERTL
ncbi:SMEK domain-containing protein [Candidatus Oscillochloris fontis]|uniref:SMEK domain-containing protein n=1 Tax=Candidatus Oscillochloris fontis TaxID=2496868 RepID=UPI00101D3F3C|nr:SMEK domain-containing protein [Candidatus Oscillochloris fontis]